MTRGTQQSPSQVNICGPTGPDGCFLCEGSTHETGASGRTGVGPHVWNPSVSGSQGYMETLCFETKPKIKAVRLFGVQHGCSPHFPVEESEVQLGKLCFKKRVLSSVPH